MMLMKRQPPDPVQAGGHPSADLLELSRETNDKWPALLPAIPASSSAGGEDGRTSLLVEREELMLQLEKLGEGSPEGMKIVRATGDLQAWMEMHREALARSDHAVDLNHYIRSLGTWMVACLRNEHETELEELRLEPDRDALFPALYFEMSGDISSLGAALRSTHKGPSDWHLKDLDLQRLSGKSRWWAQGNFQFQGGLGK